jgi:hypothetical protein
MSISLCGFAYEKDSARQGDIQKRRQRRSGGLRLFEKHLESTVIVALPATALLGDGEAVDIRFLEQPGK